MKIKQLIIISLSVLISACRAGFEADTTNDGSSSGSPNNNVSLSQLQDNIFSIRCGGAGCHSGLDPARGLRLDNVTNTYNSTVGIASSSAGLDRVSPGDVNNSYLIRKVEGRGSGNIMPPPPASPLTTSQINDIKSWINNGAPQSNGSTSGTQVYTKSQAVNDNYYRVEFEFGRKIDSAVTRTSDIEIVLEYEDFSVTTNPNSMQIDGNRLEVSVIFDEILGKPKRITTSFNQPSLAPIQDILGQAVDGDGDYAEGGVFTLEYSAESPH